MKINWNNFHLYGDIAHKQEIPVECPQEQLANAILQQGQGIAAYDLASKIYRDKGETEYDEKEADAISKLLNTLPSLWAVALKEAII